MYKVITFDVVWSGSVKSLSTIFILTLNTYNSLTTCPKFNFFILSYLEKYSVLKYATKNASFSLKSKKLLK